LFLVLEAPDKIRQFAFEISIPGKCGLDINAPHETHVLRALPGPDVLQHLTSLLSFSPPQDRPDLCRVAPSPRAASQSRSELLSLNIS